VSLIFRGINYGQVRSVKKGQTNVLTFWAVDAASAVIDLTGYTLVFQIKEPTSQAVLVAKDNGVTGGVEVVDDETGQVDVTLSVADTALLTSELVVFNLQFTDGDDVVTTAYSGSLRIFEGAVADE
jgi:hypothetical protein